jgi:hypothetical protein
MKVSGQLDAPAGEGAPGTHWKGSWVEPRAGLGPVTKNNNPYPSLESNPDRLSPQPSIYSDRADTDRNKIRPATLGMYPEQILHKTHRKIHSMYRFRRFGTQKFTPPLLTSSNDQPITLIHHLIKGIRMIMSDESGQIMEIDVAFN